MGSFSIFGGGETPVNKNEGQPINNVENPSSEVEPEVAQKPERKKEEWEILEEMYANVDPEKEERELKVRLAVLRNSTNPDKEEIRRIQLKLDELEERKKPKSY